MLNFVILGAGRPLHGEQHTALRGLSGNDRVLDWVLQAVSFLQPSVTFVGGYQVEEIARRYPEFHYVINPEWEATGAVVSFLEANLQSNCEYFVSYSDILYRERIIREMATSSADIVVAVDAAWRQRFSGRTKQDLERCEKVNCYENRVTRLGSDIDPALADAEFVGLVRFNPGVIAYLQQESSTLFERFKQAKLSQLIEYLRTRGFEVEAVDVVGDWAELNDPQDLAHFVLGTKAQTLARLQELVRCSRIEDQVSFSVAEWRANRNKIIAQVCEEFHERSLVVRSSALSEDGFSSANAGAYTSILDVDSNEASAVEIAVDQVINSYSDNNSVNQVLVQPMVNDILASGVAFTQTLDQGAPYYVINYDDVTKSTESITSGSSLEHKTLLIHRSIESDVAEVPELIRGLLPAMREIESLLNFESLDIEFAISAQGQIHILQVRPIAVDHGDLVAEKQELEAFLQTAEKRFRTLQNPSPFIVGEKAFFGVMPDWNPAEIIGTNPGLLATSLYRYLIMDDVWATQRAEYGYRDVRPYPLLAVFCGRPYVDVRASFNSFVPAVLDDNLAGRLVDFYLNWLERHPHLHDKVEFDVVPTCFDLDFQRWSERLMAEGGFTAEEVQCLGQALLKITQKALSRNALDLGTISKLESRYTKIINSTLAPLERATILLEDAKCYGTLAFSHLARNAFIAVTLLRSAVHKGVIEQRAMEGFLNSIRTVTHHFTEDAVATARGSLSWDQFVKKYGHLRPGTYDITSLSYADDPERFLRPVVAQAVTQPQIPSQRGLEAEVWREQRNRFAVACEEAGLPGDIELLEQFMRGAIEGREYAKFAFTRNVSAALNGLVEFGGTVGLERKELADIPITTFFSLRTGSLAVADIGSWLKGHSKEGKHQRILSSLVELPPLILKPSDFRVFMYPNSQANYVGNGRTVAECVDLSEDHDENSSLRGKIALIPQADPGYDWLFGQQIAGLITMYGGANSHMAIRAAEFGLPAAIGVGETQYQRLSGAAVLELDAGNYRIQVVQ